MAKEVRFFSYINIARISLIIITTFFYNIAKSEAYNKNYCNNYELKILLVKIYDIKLCSDDYKKLRYPDIYDSNFSLNIKYSMNFTQDKIINSSLLEMSKYQNINQETKEKYRKILQKSFPAVKKDDIIEAKYKKGYGLTFYFNNKYYNIVQDQEFIRNFLNIWLHKDNEHKGMIKKLYEKPRN